DQVQSKKFVPLNGTIERAMLQSWLNFCSSEMHKGGFSPLFYKGVPEEGKKVFRARLVARFNYLDEHLKSNEYLMGRDYSVADAHLFVIIELGELGAVRFVTLCKRCFVSWAHRCACRSASCHGGGGSHSLAECTALISRAHLSGGPLRLIS